MQHEQGDQGDQDEHRPANHIPILIPASAPCSTMSEAKTDSGRTAYRPGLRVPGAGPHERAAPRTAPRRRPHGTNTDAPPIGYPYHTPSGSAPACCPRYESPNTSPQAGSNEESIRRRAALACSMVRRRGRFFGGRGGLRQERLRERTARMEHARGTGRCARAVPAGGHVRGGRRRRAGSVPRVPLVPTGGRPGARGSTDHARPHVFDRPGRRPGHGLGVGVVRSRGRQWT